MVIESDPLSNTTLINSSKKVLSAMREMMELFYCEADWLLAMAAVGL